MDSIKQGRALRPSLSPLKKKGKLLWICLIRIMRLTRVDIINHDQNDTMESGKSQGDLGRFYLFIINKNYCLKKIKWKQCLETLD